MTSSKYYRDKVEKNFKSKITKGRKKLDQDIIDAQDRGRTTDYLRSKAIKEYDDKAEKFYTDYTKDIDLLDEYGKDAPKSRGFMTDYDRPQKKAGGGRVRGAGAALGGYGKGPYSDKLI